MDLKDFLTAMKQIEKLGPLEGLLKMLPGVNTEDAQAGEGRRSEAHEARRGDRALDDARGAEEARAHQRLAPRAHREGRGRPISEVNRLLEQFREMQKMMKKAACRRGGGWRYAAGMFGMTG